jgi:hypothetical protein
MIYKIARTCYFVLQKGEGVNRNFPKDSRVEIVGADGTVLGTAEVTASYKELGRRDKVKLELDSGESCPGASEEWAYFGDVDRWRQLHYDMNERTPCYSQNDPGVILRRVT